MIWPKKITIPATTTMLDPFARLKMYWKLQLLASYISFVALMNNYQLCLGQQEHCKVKFLVCIFSLLLSACALPRSPSYPPPGCGKNKKKLKPEQDGCVSKSHRLLRRNCSSTVKPEVDGCAGKSHKLLGHSLSVEPRLELPPVLKPQAHRLLPRAAVKPEDCGGGLRPHRLLPRSGSGEPRCEHSGSGSGGSSDGGSALKTHRLLSRSCSGNVRTEELDGLKHHHRLLSRSYSSSTKMGKGELPKEPAGESRRLSLTSGLIGILAPALSSTPPVRSIWTSDLVFMQKWASKSWNWHCFIFSCPLL